METTSFSSRKLAVCAFALLVLFTILEAVSASCPAGLDCKVCSENRDCNTIAGLPRINSVGVLSSNNIVDYDIQKCKSTSIDSLGHPVRKNCSWVSFSDIDMSKTNSDSRAPVNYVFGLGLYAAFAFVLIISVCVTMCVLSCRGCTGCCCKGGCPAGNDPTPTYACGSCKCCPCLGMSQDPTTKKWGYSNCSRWFVRIYIWVFCISVFCFIMVGFFKGVDGLKNSVEYSINEAPQPLLVMGGKMSRALVNLTVNTASLPIANTVKSVNSTIAQSLSLSTIRATAACVVNRVETALPNLTSIYAYVDNVEITINDIGNFFTTAPASLNNVRDGLANLRSELVTMKGTIDSADVAIPALRTTIINEFNTGMSPINTAINGWKSSTEGGNALASALTSLRTPGLADTDATQVLGSGNDGLAKYKSGDAATDVNAIASALNTINSRYGTTQSSPALVTAKTLSGKSSTWSSQASPTQFTTVANVVAGTKNRFFTQANTTLDSLDKSIASIQATLAAISFQPMKDQLTALQNKFTNLPSTEVFNVELARVLTLRQVFPCFDELVLSMLNINNTIYQTDTMVTIMEVRDKLVQGLNDLEVKAQEFLTNQVSMKDLINVASLQDTITNAEKLKNELEDKLVTNLSTASMRSSLAQKINDANVDNNLVNGFTSVGTALDNSKLDASLVSKLNTLSTDLNTLSPKLAAVLGDVQAWGLGYCLEGPTTRCTASSGGCTCVGVKQARCVTAYTVPCAVNGDATCTTGSDRCNHVPARIQEVIDAISAIRTTVNDNTLTSNAGKSTALQTTSDNADTGPLSNSFTTAVSSVTVDMGPTKSQIQSAIDSVDNSSFDPSKAVTDLQAVFNEASTTIITNMRSALNELQTAYDKAVSDLQLLKDAQQLVNLIYDYSTTELGRFMEEISTSRLNAALASGGILGMVRQLTSVPDNSTRFFSTSSLVKITPTSFTADVEKQHSWAKHVDLLLNPLDVDAGAMHMYFAQTYGVESVVRPNDPSAYGVFRNKIGQYYEERKVCATRPCISNELNRLWTGGPALQMTQELLFDMNMTKTRTPFANLGPFTLRDVLGVGYVFPAIAVLIAAISTVIVCKKPCCRKYQTCTAGCGLACIFIQLPIILFVCLVAFPFAMLTGDVCYSAESVAAEVYLPSMNLCNTFKGTALESGMCFVEVGRDRFFGFNASFDAYAAAVTTFGECKPEKDGIKRVIDSVKDAAVAMPSRARDQDVVPTLVNNNVRPQMIDSIVNQTGNWSHVLAVFGNDTNEALSCQSISTLYRAFKEAMCCYFTDSLWWVASSWFLIAWSMLFCGIPSLLLGRKRLAYEPWGADYQALTNAQALLNEQSPYGDADAAQKGYKDPEALQVVNENHNLQGLSDTGTTVAGPGGEAYRNNGAGTTGASGEGRSNDTDREDSRSKHSSPSVPRDVNGVVFREQIELSPLEPGFPRPAPSGVQTILVSPPHHHLPPYHPGVGPGGPGVPRQVISLAPHTPQASVTAAVAAVPEHRSRKVAPSDAPDEI